MAERLIARFLFSVYLLRGQETILDSGQYVDPKFPRRAKKKKKIDELDLSYVFQLLFNTSKYKSSMFFEWNSLDLGLFQKTSVSCLRDSYIEWHECSSIHLWLFLTTGQCPSIFS